MDYAKVCLHRGEERDIRSGGWWVYDNEIDWIDDICTDGGIVDVLDSRMQFVARGYFNRRSKIAVRVLTRDESEVIDRDFFRRRVETAWNFRQSLGFSNACRVVFGESDGLPGLTVDKFGDYLSFQTVSLGIEQWKPDIIEILVELFQPKGIYERNDVPVRAKEGLEQITGCVYGEVPPLTTIREHDAAMLVDIAHGQKTGHFLDQQENRGRIAPYCPGRTVLDLCCHTGGFSIHAALYGASSVESVDVSEEALQMVLDNAKANGVSDKITTTCGNVFDIVRKYADDSKQYGLVICDPPAFAKSRKALEGAYRGYKELNLRSMKLVEPGGFLVSCSCSQFMTPELFLKMLREAAADCGRQARLLEILMQSRDHPATINAEQSHYLKGYILQII
ncbi:class I SAM-dependent rRNA methyltransferase [Candidatus Avoscillospira sp. LCP25S3_F1]|uniref:class I SAM-dependent rRNA methyltransferase n=1 Tax=Candidatus Avoscillospira sp. LCP25S3_F1 TaxID=3438825 RepID=UPI003F908BB0